MEVIVKHVESRGLSHGRWNRKVFGEEALGKFLQRGEMSIINKTETLEIISIFVLRRGKVGQIDGQNEMNAKFNEEGVKDGEVRVLDGQSRQTM